MGHAEGSAQRPRSVVLVPVWVFALVVVGSILEVVTLAGALIFAVGVA